MNFNFTDGCRRALSAAREEAIGLGHDHVGTEHILLGTLRDDLCEALLRRMGVAPGDVRALLMGRLPSGEPAPPPTSEPTVRGAGQRKMGLFAGRQRTERTELPYSSRAKKALEFAMAEAREAADDFVSTEHLLLGLLREERSLAANVLRDLGVTLERGRIARAGGDVTEVSRLRVTIDDASERSIYEQIIAQVTEAVATGQLRPGERLPTVRQLADELDIAPGTVARAYSELEGKQLVVTEGARGTRVAVPAAEPEAAHDRAATLAGLLRPVAVAAFHLGGNAAELRAALEEAMRGIFDRGAAA